MRYIKLFLFMGTFLALVAGIGTLGVIKANAATLITDINFDSIVDIKDLAEVAIAYNTKLGDLNWKPNLDLTKDNIVDIYDLVFVSKYIGQNSDFSNNINNLGFVATDGKWTYYVNASNGSLHRKELGGSVVTLVTADNTSYINVVNGRVYYQNASDDGKLYSINVDGTDKIKLSDDIVTFVNVIGGYIYYYSNSGDLGFYRINGDGTGKIKISKLTENTTPQDIIIDNGWVYCTEESEQNVFNIYKIRIDGTGKTTLSTRAGSGLVKNGDWLYYINPLDGYKLYKLSVDGMNTVKVMDDIVLGLGTSGDWIYYSYCADLEKPFLTGKLYKIKTDGTSKTLLAGDSPFYINVVGDWVYYLSLDYEGAIYKVKIDGTSPGPVDYAA